MRWSFSEHPASVGESYVEHLGTAWSFAWRMLVAGCACVMHGLFPFLFVKTGSLAIRELHDRMVVNRTRASNPSPAGRRNEPALDFSI
ncbi:MAG TPA: DUF6356 family protein [Stellaceae bacterium]